ncbi:MAG: aspartate aminotransferase family protein [Fusobacteriaceae bacterium]
MDSKIIDEGQKYVMNTYTRFPIVLKEGKGCYVTDTEGKKYLDFVAGIAVNSLGHGNEKLAKVIAEQAKKLIHVSNLYWTEPQVSLAKKLVELSCFDKVFFCNSGAESIEGALKLVRKYATKNNSGKTDIITMKNSFHGRTYGAVTATGQDKYQKGLTPLLSGFKYSEYNNFEELLSLVDDKTGGILIEPIQGEGGVTSATKEFLQKVRELCTEKDIILIFDEIQCGVGRTGNFFAYEYFGVEPDVLTLAKGLAGGVPIGVLLAKEKFALAFAPGDHASTFGGNPLATSAGNFVVDELKGGLIKNISEMGNYLRTCLEDLQKKYPSKIIKLKGVGLIQGIELSEPVSDIVKNCIASGLLLVNAGTNVIRFVPPLIVGKEEINECIKILDAALSN